MAAKVTLRDAKIMDSWSMLIEEGQGKADQVYKDTEAYIRESKAPGVRMEMVKVTPGVIAGLFGIERNYLMVTNEGLRDFRM